MIPTTLYPFVSTEHFSKSYLFPLCYSSVQKDISAQFNWYVAGIGWSRSIQIESCFSSILLKKLKPSPEQDIFHSPILHAYIHFSFLHKVCKMYHKMYDICLYVFWNF